MKRERGEGREEGRESEGKEERCKSATEGVASIAELSGQTDEGM